MERVHLQLAAFPRYGNTNMTSDESAVILVTSDTGELLKN